jgi:hypothetical protein
MPALRSLVASHPPEHFCVAVRDGDTVLGRIPGAAIARRLDEKR